MNIISEESSYRAPLPPKWVYEPWVWDDNMSRPGFSGHCQQQVLDLVNGYIAHDIPVGVVVIDSPWESNFNTFEFEPPAFPNPQAMIDSLHRKNVRVILWITNIINRKADERFWEDWFKGGVASNYRYARDNDYFAANGQIFGWWWGEGCFIDHSNPDASRWLATEMEKALRLRIDGWKVDASTRKFPHTAPCFAGVLTKAEYSYLYYQEFYYISRKSTNNRCILFTKPLDDNRADSTYVPAQYTHVAWVGDQSHAWSDEERGLENAIINMQMVAKKHFIAMGSDIGGFSSYKYGEYSLIERELFIRWLQLGAFSPIMENGGYDEHRPWMYDREVLDIYRLYATLHHELVPYLFSEGYKAHLNDGSIVKPLDNTAHTYLLGENLFIVPIYEPLPYRNIKFPKSGDTWLYFWDHTASYPSGAYVDRFDIAIDQYPVFVRKGAILPLHVDNNLTGHGLASFGGYTTVLMFPSDSSGYSYYRENGSITDFICQANELGMKIDISASHDRYILHILSDSDANSAFLNGLPLPYAMSQEEFEGQEICWYKTGSGAVWVKFMTTGTKAVVTISTRVVVAQGKTGLDNIPQSYQVSPFYPNPFSSGASGNVIINNGTRIRIEVYNVLGQVVRTLAHGYHNSGHHAIVWDGRDVYGREVPNGVYLIRTEMNGRIDLKKVLKVSD